MISGRTDLLAILGDPIAQAKTPALVNEALARRAADAVLVPMRVPPEDLAEVVGGLRRIGNFRGAVVTMPHKRAVLPLLDAATSQARATGACNVLRREPDGSLVGDMLDGEGMVAALAAAGHPVTGRSVFLAGAGGAATGIAFALARHGAATLTLRNRTERRAAELAGILRGEYPAFEVTIAPDEYGAVSPRGVGADIAVNATSLGMRAEDPLSFDVSALAGTTVVADVVSRPDTALLTAATARGCQCVDGIQMLTAQVDLMIDHMLAAPTADAVARRGGSDVNR